MSSKNKKRNYEIWLTYNRGKQKFRFPVLPENYKVDNGSKNESVNISGLGEIVIKQDRPALVFSFSSFFPANKFSGVQYKKLPDPQKAYDKINKWKNATKPVHLVMTAAGINMYCTIESFSKEEKGGDIGTIYYTLKLKEYRETKIRKINVDKKTKKAKIGKASKSRVDNADRPKTYKVKSGDCLWNIAKKIYGSGEQYMKIYNANKKIIGGNPNNIKAGQVLTIP